MTGQPFKSPMPKAWDCQNCDATNYYGRYAYAHWNEKLAANCSECGQPHIAHAGRVTIVRKGRKK